MRTKIIIVGAGGHARVVALIVVSSSEMEIVGVADRNRENLGERVGPSMVNTTFDDLSEWHLRGVTAVALALGDNVEREGVMHAAEQSGLGCVTLVHSSALIDSTVLIGGGTVIAAGAIVTPEVSLGRGVIVNTGAIIDHECIVGDFSQISPGVNVAGRVKIGTRVMIGTGANILPGLHIGKDAIVGAGAVVLEDVPAGVTVAGCPARIIRQ